MRRLNSGCGQRLDEDWSAGNLTFKYSCHFGYTFNVLRKVSREVHDDVQMTSLKFDVRELRSQIQFLSG